MSQSQNKFIQSWNAVHAIGMSGDSTSVGRKSESEVTIEFIETLDFSPSSVYGVTKLENKFYLLCGDPNSIHILKDESPFPLQQKIDLEEIENPFDIAACERSRCIYVVERSDDTKIGKIWKLSADDHKLTLWLAEIQKPSPLSVTSDGHLLILGRAQSSSQLVIYTPDAKVSQVLHLSDDIGKPLHAIQKSSKEFVISFRTNSPTAAGLARKMSRKISGGLAKGLSQQQGDKLIFQPSDKSQKLKYPRHFCLDSDHNRLFLADFENNKIILLDSDSLSVNQILLKSDNIRSPFRVHYDCKKRQLIVAHEESEISIYELS